jgi:hypothetical protein
MPTATIAKHRYLASSESRKSPSTSGATAKRSNAVIPKPATVRAREL